ncbi:hypothetical protein [Streptococcus oriscaviae]|uniref:Uncharacterized protein n=1 Tax=Streptococcus oriscaviae TaxID=2781599 RepID=A0ABX7YN37_9STRE|nr:hypothetical protein [Streptococcus oriscaviae]QUE54639.1 hypothetical protein INT76_01740 [Streptococcus oriscaviae]
MGNRKTYAYDQAGRLIQRHEADTIETFQYDWEDKLLKRQSWQKADLQAVEFSQKFAKNQENLTACKGTQFVYHHHQLVAEVPLQTDGNLALQANWADAIYWL